MRMKQVTWPCLKKKLLPGGVLQHERYSMLYRNYSIIRLYALLLAAEFNKKNFFAEIQPTNATRCQMLSRYIIPTLNQILLYVPPHHF